MPRFAIVELMGRRRFGAEVEEVERYGIKMLYAKILCDPPMEQYVHPQALYAETPCSEEDARRANDPHNIRAIHPKQLPWPGEEWTTDDDEDEQDDEDEEGSDDIPL